MITVEEALTRVLALVRPLPAEAVPLRRAAGRVLAEDAVARLTQPPFAASAMDGYAIREGDHRAGATLRVTGEAAAGHPCAGRVGTGEAVRIFTGAPVPDGADRVVLQEDVTRDGDVVRLTGRLEHGNNIRPAGQDFRKGDRVAAPRLLRAFDLALLASMNLPEVRVARRPVVALVATGDELVQPGEEPGPGQIVASNGVGLAAMAESAGAEVRLLPIARDSEAALRAVFDLAAGADVIVTIGGASVGDHDLVGKVAADMGLERAFWKVAMRPGKPLMAGRLGDGILLGLPGNPVSAMVCAKLFLQPLLRALQGLPGTHDLQGGELAVDLPENGPRAHYMRARVEPGDGLPLIRPFDRQDSALLSILSGADALLLRPAGDVARRAGETVPWMAM